MGSMHVQLHATVWDGVTTRQTKAGHPFGTFAVVYDQSGEREFVNVSCFQPNYDTLPALAKGDTVFIKGTGRINRWTDAQGRERVNLQVTAEEVTKMDMPRQVAMDMGARKHANGPRRFSAKRDYARPSHQVRY